MRKVQAFIKIHLVWPKNLSEFFYVISVAPPPRYPCQAFCTTFKTFQNFSFFTFHSSFFFSDSAISKRAPEEIATLPLAMTQEAGLRRTTQGVPARSLSPSIATLWPRGYGLLGLQRPTLVSLRGGFGRRRNLLPDGLGSRDGQKKKPAETNFRLL